MPERITLLHQFAIGGGLADAEPGEYREHGFAHAPRGRAQLGARGLHLDLRVDSSDNFEADPRLVRRNDNRAVELGPARAKLTDDEDTDGIGAGHHTAVGQTLQSPRERNRARGEEAVAELENRKRVRNVAHSALHVMRPVVTRCSRRST
jgi:hypothetical protein